MAAKSKGKLKVKSLSAALQVPMLGPDGEQLHRNVGIDAAGAVVVEPATRILFFDRGDELPSGLTDEELERLKADDAIGPADEVDEYIRRLSDPAAAAEEDKRAAEARLALVRGETGPVDASNLAAATDQQLAAWISDESPKVDEVVASAGDDPELAGRLLEAERAATKGDARKGVEEGLQAIIDRGSEQ
jgi:hypothetical protein